MYRTAFGFQITSAQTSVRPFLSLETGIAIIHSGKVASREFVGPVPDMIVLYWPQFVPQSASTSLKGFASFGFGVVAPVNSSIGLKFEARWFDTWNNGDAYFPLTATVPFRL
jgi:hypothetical protein